EGEGRGEEGRGGRSAERGRGGGGEDRLPPYAPREGSEWIGHRLAHVPVPPHRDRTVVHSLREALDFERGRRHERGDGAGLKPEDASCRRDRPLEVERLAPPRGDGPLGAETRRRTRAVRFERPEPGAVDAPTLGLRASGDESISGARHHLEDERTVAPRGIRGEADAGDSGFDLLLHHEADAARRARIGAHALARPRRDATTCRVDRRGDRSYTQPGLEEARER